MPERCDRCIAWGVVEWWNIEGWAQLMMCEHHAREHAPVMYALGYVCRAARDVWGLELKRTTITVTT